MIIIWGFGQLGATLYRELTNSVSNETICFADNNPDIQGQYVNHTKVFSLESLLAYHETHKDEEIKVYIASLSWKSIANQLIDYHFHIVGYYVHGKLYDYESLDWNKVKNRKTVKLYAGDICDEIHLADKDVVGLSINKEDCRHILHDITTSYPLPDDSVDSYQAEDVLEHIEYDKLVDVINEIWRVLKPGSVFRLSLPDYFSPYLKNITLTDKDGHFLYDPTGGGKYIDHTVVKGGHVWFPTIENVKPLLEKSKFSNINYLCYREADGTLKKDTIDYTNGHVIRLAKCHSDEGIYSLLIDCRK